MAASKRYYTYNDEISTNIWTDDGNGSTDSYTLNGSDFAVSGDTTSNMGSITSLSVSHWHTASGGNSYQWTVWVVVTFGNGNYYKSDEITQACNGTNVEWVNTITTIPVATFITGIQSIKLVRNKPASGHSLYIRSSSYWGKIVGTLLFDTYAPVAPTVTASFESGTIYQNATSPVFQHTESFDQVTSATGVSFLLRLYKLPDYDVSYNIVSGDVVLPKVPVYSSANKPINWTYSVTDTNGQTTKVDGTLGVTAYTPPIIETFMGVRDSETPSQIVVSITANRGTKNLTGVKMYMQQEGESKASVIDVTFENTRTSYSATHTASNMQPNSVTYFDLEVSDGIAISTARISVNPYAPLFNIEKTGVGVGKLVQNGTLMNPKFEVAMPATFSNTATFNTTANFTNSVYIKNVRLDEAETTSTITSFTSPFTTLSGYLPKLIRLGPIVFFRGGAHMSADLASGSMATLTNSIPIQYRPSETISIIAYTTMGTCVRLIINSSGNIAVKNEASFTLSSGNDIYFSDVWVAGDSM